MKKLLTLKTYSIVITILLLIALGSLLLMRQNLKWANIENQAVPRVELINYLKWNGQALSGKVAGFVAFENAEDQPKDMKQFIIIEASDYNPELKRQLITLQNIYAFNNLAPRFADKEVLNIKEISDRKVDLVDSAGNLYEIDKSSGEVLLVDAGGDITRLITDQSKYRDFIVDWLK